MANFTVPSKEQVSEENQKSFTNLKGALGFVPNIYAYMAHSKTALKDYLALSGRKSSLSIKEQEIVNLATSQLNGCQYCLGAHTMIAKNNGFSGEQVIEARNGEASYDEKLNVLAQFTKEAVDNRGSVSEASKDKFFEAGFTEENLVDVVMLIGDRTITNLMHNLAQFKVDFPAADPMD
ncbi:carboxymuconolactone decarboxylase family protein [Persicobacter psychrovividus]|uniref:Alkyl hydroperoxide reductase AhpD n=1 Tax=Persicobacter psychrovividus TaxID=387638 RepID=A0ABN6L6Y5_9BACT|nr:alkyl hydroperoxide reductase AhpD [Persicobacter psychrovividus]